LRNLSQHAGDDPRERRGADRQILPNPAIGRFMKEDGEVIDAPGA
jgi:hypothetical protein